MGQGALDEWVAHSNPERPHPSLGDATPEQRLGGEQRPAPRAVAERPAGEAVAGSERVSRKVTVNGVACVGAHRVSVVMHFSGSHAASLVRDGLLQLWIGDQLVAAAECTDP